MAIGCRDIPQHSGLGRSVPVNDQDRKELGGRQQMVSGNAGGSRLRRGYLHLGRRTYGDRASALA